MAYTKQGFVNYDSSKPLKAEQLIAMEDAIIDNEYSLKGKVISVLGDSISTFKGYIPTADGFNEEHPHTYPGQGVTTWNKTWWGQVISRLGAKLGVNDSWSGSRVQNTHTAENPGGNVGTKVCMPSITRISNLGSNGTPDIIFFFGGTNDGKFSTFGDFDDTKVYSTVDLEAVTWTSFQDAYVAALMRLQHFYPNARIITMTPMYVASWYDNARCNQMSNIIKKVSDYFGVTCIDMRKCGITMANKSSYLGDGLHPNFAGMTKMADYIIAQMSKSVILDKTENIVCKVTNSLTGVSTNKPHIVGVSKGTAYTATLTGSNLSGVKVTMGGKDITSSALASGVITIAKVTGDILISNQ